MSLSFEKLNEVNVLRCELFYRPVSSWTPQEWACALGGEAGECLNWIKKLKRAEDLNDEAAKQELLIEIGKELGDIITYADLLAHNLGLNLGDCVKNKFNEVSDRIKSNIKL